MKIVGNSKQDGIPSPDNPVKITNETVLIITDKEGNKKEMSFKYEKILKEGDNIEKINGEWCLVRRKPMNNIEILEDYLKFIKQFDNNSDFIPALENLIQENKELKEKLKNEQISHKNDSDSMNEINEKITQDTVDCLKIIDKYRFCKVEKLKDFYKEIKEIFEGE